MQVPMPTNRLENNVPPQIVAYAGNTAYQPTVTNYSVETHSYPAYKPAYEPPTSGSDMTYADEKKNQGIQNGGIYLFGSSNDATLYSSNNLNVMYASDVGIPMYASGNGVQSQQYSGPGQHQQLYSSFDPRNLPQYEPARQVRSPVAPGMQEQSPSQTVEFEYDNTELSEHEAQLLQKAGFLTCICF